MRCYFTHSLNDTIHFHCCGPHIASPVGVHTT